MNEYITLGEAFNHCFGTTSYCVYLAIGVLVFLAGIFGLKKSYDKEGWGTGKILVLFLLLAILLTVILLRPTSIAANTTKEQAARGVYIGY